MGSSQSVKKVESIRPKNLPKVKPDELAKAFTELVNRSMEEPHIATPMDKVKDAAWVHKLVPGIDNLAVKYHIGNYVAIRGGSDKVFESMPLYTRSVCTVTSS